ncbi:hypothetical protein M758_1G071200 [Ceratodon purpureus]|nr:hypothetical protein M758_1G071200 [Ceratodon purpureus]
MVLEYRGPFFPSLLISLIGLLHLSTPVHSISPCDLYSLITRVASLHKVTNSLTNNPNLS